MVEQIVGNAEVLLTPEESVLSDAQVAAQKSGTVSKTDAKYQNKPRDGEQCSHCTMFVSGFHNDPGGFCTKVRSYRGPLGMIFSDGWCKFFEEDALRAAYEANADADSVSEEA